MNTGIRAKKHTCNGQRLLSTHYFHDFARQGVICFPCDLHNRCHMYNGPLIGQMTCIFKGVVDSCTNISTVTHLKYNDTVCFEWQYQSGRLGDDMAVFGITRSYYKARYLVLHSRLPPRTTRIMVDAVCVAKVYKLLFETPSLLPCIKQYQIKHRISSDVCRVVKLCFPKQLAELPSIETFVDSTGHSVKMIVCATVGQSTLICCHPGSFCRYMTNRYTYKVSEIQVMDRYNQTGRTFQSFRRCTRMASFRDIRQFPTSLDDVNTGDHQGPFATSCALTQLLLPPLNLYNLRCVCIVNVTIVINA